MASGISRVTDWEESTQGGTKATEGEEKASDLMKVYFNAPHVSNIQIA